MFNLICLSVYLSVCLFVCLFACLSSCENTRVPLKDWVMNMTWLSEAFSLQFWRHKHAVKKRVVCSSRSNCCSIYKYAPSVQLPLRYVPCNKVNALSAGWAEDDQTRIVITDPTKLTTQNWQMSTKLLIHWCRIITDSSEFQRNSFSPVNTKVNVTCRSIRVRG